MSDYNLDTYEVITPESIEDWKEIIQDRIDKIVIDGKVNYGTFLKNLDKPRRGWLNSGLHPKIAETSRQHGLKLRDAANAYGCNEYCDVNGAIMPQILEIHDDIDAIFFDFTPDDYITLAQKATMEQWGMEQFYNSIRNGLGHNKLYHLSLFNNKRLREGKLGFWHDKQDADTEAVRTQNTFEEVEKFYKQNPECQLFLFDVHKEANTLEQALEITYNKLDRFHPYNLERFDEPFMKEIAKQVKAYKGADVYTHYYNILSTFNPRDYE